MRNLGSRALARLHDRYLQRRRQRDLRRDLRPDEGGLTMLAYALGAAVIIVPLALLVFAFGSETVNDAGDRVNNALAAAP